MLEFLRDYFVYFWNLLFRGSTPPSAALTTAGTEIEKKPAAEAKPEKEPIAKPESVIAETVPEEPAKRDPSPPKPIKPPSEPQKPEPAPPKPTQIPQPISRPVQPDEHVLKPPAKFDAPPDKRDDFVEFERLQQSRVQEAQAAPPADDDSYQIEDEEIESIVEEILNYEEELPDEQQGDLKYADDDLLQRKIRDHLKALQEQETQFQYQTPSQILKSVESAPQKPSAQLKYASEEQHFEDRVADAEE